MDQPHERGDLLDLAALHVADEVPREGVAVGGDLRLQLLRLVAAGDRDAGLGERGEVVDRDVLDRRDELHLGAVAPAARRRRRDPLAYVGEVGAHACGRRGR